MTKKTLPDHKDQTKHLFVRTSHNLQKSDNCIQQQIPMFISHNIKNSELEESHIKIFLFVYPVVCCLYLGCQQFEICQISEKFNLKGGQSNWH